MIPINLSSLINNLNSPKFDPAFPLGNRGSGGVQLTAGHYVAEKFAMVAMQPRPDSETGSFSGTVNARYRWAYYDGVNSIQYEFPIKIFGGSAPHRYTIISAPAGAAVGNTWNPDSHGLLTWTPQAAFSTSSPASFTVRVTGQDGNTLDLTWTVATSSSTSKFLFLSNSGNDSTGTGSISNPFATLAKVFGTTKTSSNFPGAQVIMRGGSYATAPHSDSWIYGGETVPCRIELDPSLKPSSFTCYPNENVTIDFSAAEVMLNADDNFWGGNGTGLMTINGSANLANETHNFWVGGSRNCWHKLRFDGFIPRVNSGYTNSVPIFSAGSYTNPTRLYHCAHDVREINRTASSSNDGMLWVLFGISYWADEYCAGTRVGSGPGFKDTCYNTSTRYGFFDCTTDTFGFAIMSQSGGGNNEICYSRVRGNIWFNFQAFQGALGKMYEYRNNIISVDSNYDGAVRAWGTAGGHQEWASINSVMHSRALPYVMPLITDTGSEARALNTSNDKPLNTTTLNLQDVGGGTAWRTLYLGTRGAEII